MFKSLLYDMLTFTDLKNFIIVTILLFFFMINIAEICTFMYSECIDSYIILFYMAYYAI